MAVTTLGRRLIDSFTSFKEATCTHYNEVRKSRRRKLKHQHLQNQQQNKQQQQQQIFTNGDNREHHQKLLWFFSFCTQKGTNGIRDRKNNSSRVYNSQKQYGSHSSKVFGCELLDHVNYFNATDDCVPQIVKCCANYIEKHGILFGIYRLSGMRLNIHKLRHDFDENPLQQMIDSETISNDAHAVACVMKQYFRELPTPLLTFQLYDKFVNLFKPEQTHDRSPLAETSSKEPQLMSMSSIVQNSNMNCISSMPTSQTINNLKCPSKSNTDKDIEEKDDDDIEEQTKKHQVILEDLRQLLLQLPKAHFKTLKFLMRHLACIAANGDKTGMDSKNVAIVWAPNLLKPKELELTGGLETLQMIGIQAVLTEQLIRHHEFLLGDDGEDMSQSPPNVYNRHYTTDGLTTSNSSSINDFHSAADLIMYD